MSAPVVYHRAPWSTNCERVSLALAHKGVGAELVTISYDDRSAVEAISGQSLVPVIDDGGAVVNDSVAIIRHLERHHPDPPLFPAAPDLRAELDLFIEWFERVFKYAPNAIEDELVRPDPDRARIAALDADMARHLDRFEALLHRREFLLGGLSAADLIAYPFLKYAAGREPADDELFHVVLDSHLTLGDRPRLASWIDRIAGLPRAFDLA